MTMAIEPLSTVRSPIYRDITETMNKTLFDVFIKESYMPIVHGVYLANPNITPIHMPDPFEEDNFCRARLPIKNIVEMTVLGHEFAFAFARDAIKVKGIIDCYVAQFEGINLNNDPEQKAFIENCKETSKVLGSKRRNIENREHHPQRKLSIAERLAML